MNWGTAEGISVPPCKRALSSLHLPSYKILKSVSLLIPFFNLRVTPSSISIRFLSPFLLKLLSSRLLMTFLLKRRNKTIEAVQFYLTFFFYLHLTSFNFCDTALFIFFLSSLLLSLRSFALLFHRHLSLSSHTLSTLLGISSIFKGNIKHIHGEYQAFSWRISSIFIGNIKHIHGGIPNVFIGNIKHSYVNNY